MRYNPSPSKAEMERRAQSYVGRTVRDTKGRWGVVQSAWVASSDGMVDMAVTLANTEDVFFTDSHHATIVRTPTEEFPVPEYERHEPNRFDDGTLVEE